MRFRFRLERILNLRQREEDVVRLDLARVNREITQVQMEIERIERELRSTDVSRELERCKDLDPGFVVRRHQGHLTALEGSVREAREEESRLFRERSDVNARLIQARRDRAAVEKLRERALRKHRQESERQERKEMDEVAARLYQESLRDSLISEEEDATDD